MTSPKKSFDSIWLPGDNCGYAVYRVPPVRLTSKEIYARANEIAIFITELEAQNYCDYRSAMAEKYGSADVTKITDFGSTPAGGG